MKAKLYINKDNLKYNIEYIQKKIGKDKKIIAMVKANAYGCGDVLLSGELQKLGIEDFGVANIDEAARLRSNNISGMILITSVCTGQEIERAIKNDISMSVSDIDNIVCIDKQARKMNKKARIHIKIDTGMTRLGFNHEEIIKNIDKILSLKNIYVDGIYTHLSCADMDEDYTKGQLKEFSKIKEELDKFFNFKYVHVLNSDGTEKYANDIEYTHVRVGLMIYGYSKNTKPILKLTAPIMHINYIDKYTKVGYGGTFIAKPKMKIAVIKIGYADGLSRSLSNKIKVMVNGVECNLVGNICMDMSMIDVSNVDNVNINDEVVIWDYSNNLENISKLSNKIVYEVISNLGNRIERVIE